VLVTGLGLGAWLVAAAPPAPAEACFEIQVVDEATGRGVPLVELETVNHVRFVTDSAGRIAFREPGLMGRDTFLRMRAHGYVVPKDGLGFAGIRLIPKAGERAIVRLKRINLAERMYRITGEGIYRDSVLLGYQPPVREPLLNAGVMGQDSAQAAVYRGRIYWFWGDTLFTRHPLGNYRTSGAVSELPAAGGLDPAVGINLRYFTDQAGFSRAMCPLDKGPGVVWIDGVIVVPDAKGRDRMVAHYARMKSLEKMLEHGIAVWADEKEIFERVKPLPLTERWRFPHGHPFHLRQGDREYVYCGNPFALVRVPARYEALLDPEAYEAWTCARPQEDEKDAPPLRHAAGALRHDWQRRLPPQSAAMEDRWLKQGAIKGEECFLLPIDVDSGKRIRLHGGSVRWNAYRKKWVLIAVEQGGTSFLGEVWYAEAEVPIGPWQRAKKIVTHDKYSFYNPVHHPFFDQAGGRLIYFEGTYTRTFSGNADATPRYDYNQVMYRLNLDDERLRGVRQDKSE